MAGILYIGWGLNKIHINIWENGIVYDFVLRGILLNV